MNKVKKYRKRPVIIEAIKTTDYNHSKIIEFCPDIKFTEDDGAIYKYIIPTKEGDMICNIGDYIIKGVEGEFYPCKPEIFKKHMKK